MKRFLIFSLLLLNGCLLPRVTDTSGGSLTLSRDSEIVTAKLNAGAQPAERPVLYFGGSELETSESECRTQGNGLACAVGIPRLEADRGKSCWVVPCDLPANRTYTAHLSGRNISANVTLYRPDGSQSFLRYTTP